MYDEARLLNASGGGDPVPKGQCLAIGDRLDTNIEAGNRGGYDSLAVLTGVTNPRELMLAPAHLRPTYVARRPARPAGARPPLEERYPGLAALSACDDEGKAKVLHDVLDGLRRELDEEQA